MSGMLVRRRYRGVYLGPLVTASGLYASNNFVTVEPGLDNDNDIGTCENSSGWSKGLVNKRGVRGKRRLRQHVHCAHVRTYTVGIENRSINGWGKSKEAHGTDDSRPTHGL